MFGNFLEETATGTGATLALAGATTGNIQFQEKFADGDLVAYVVDDSGGTIKVGGIGTYVSATDDITRSDTWSWNGTTYDDNPSTNITLSGGTHTVRCDVLGYSINRHIQRGFPSGRIFTPHNLNYERNATATGEEFTPAANLMTIVTATFEHPVLVTSVGAQITTASAGGNLRVGVWSINADNSVGSLIIDSGDISTAATGQILVTLGSPVSLDAGSYYTGVVADNSGVKGYGPSAASNSNTAGAVSGGKQGALLPNQREAFNKYSVTYGALPSTLTSPTGNTTDAAIQGIFQ